ncbi:MAG: F0F1 ATP synthase subunit delta [Puniceicoccales bacterium]|nr:F0F1 ATP synthase subunit delta [Puniceicoccales bacterium]
MPHTAQTAALARKLTALAFAPDTREPDIHRVRAIIDTLATHPPAIRRVVLKKLASNLAREAGKRELRVEYAGPPPSPETIARLTTHFSTTTGRPVTPVLTPNHSLLAGLRIRLADDLFESTLSARLSQLTA